MPGEPPGWLGPSDLIEPVRRLLGDNVTAIDDWSVEPLVGGAGDALGVWRVTGTLPSNGATTPWAIILKGWAAPSGPDHPTAWNSPSREARAYASGALNDLPAGIRAPHCLGSRVLADGSRWVWLRPMSDGALDTWTIDHYELVGRHLGQFNGAYLAGHPLPDAPWLSTRWIRQWVDAAGDTIAQLDSARSVPLVAQSLPSSVMREVVRVWDERHSWLDALESLPQTFSHLDAFKRNIFLRPGTTGSLETGLIDWGFTGVAAAGEEIAPLVAASLLFDEAPGITPAALDASVFEGYVNGLRDSGWTGDERLVRAGYTGSVVLRYGVGALRVVLPLLINAEMHARLEQMLGMPVHAIAAMLAEINEWIAEIGDEFRRHLSTLPPAVGAA